MNKFKIGDKVYFKQYAYNPTVFQITEIQKYKHTILYKGLNLANTRSGKIEEVTANEEELKALTDAVSFSMQLDESYGISEYVRNSYATLAKMQNKKVLVTVEVIED